MKINNYNVDPNKIFLRSSNNGISYKGFRRKKVGAWNKAKNWTGIPRCFKCGGFFGIDKEFCRFGINYNRLTIEMCEWRGKRVPIENDKICVSEYRVVAINEDIPDFVFKQCGYGVLRNNNYINKISDGRWIIFGGEIKKITGGIQHFRDRFLAGNVIISGGYQYFWDKSSADKAKIAGGLQCFYDKSSAGNTIITGGDQRFCNESSAGNVRISAGKQSFYNKSLADQAEISGGDQRFWDRSSANNAKITGGIQCFYDKSSVGNAKIFGGRQYFYDESSASNAKKARYYYKRIYKDIR